MTVTPNYLATNGSGGTIAAVANGVAAGNSGTAAAIPSGAAAGGGGGGQTQPLRFAIPNNSIAQNSGWPVSGTQTDGLSRMKITIGSGDRSYLVLSFYGWNMTAAALTLQPNAYTVVGCYLEKGDGSQSVQVTFDGGSGTKVINAGDTDIQSDRIQPSSFTSTSVFARDSTWFVRLQVRAATGNLPGGTMLYTDLGFPAQVGLRIDPAVYVSSTVGGTGNMPATGSGWTDNYKAPYLPIALGPFVSGDPVTILGIGDSIIAGAGDNATSVPVHGSFQRALFNTDLATGAIGGCNMGSSGAVGSLWQGTNAALGKAYWKYAKHAVEEFGTNEFLNVGSGTAGQATCTLNWTALRAAGIQSIVRPLLTPRVTGTSIAAANISGSGTTVTISNVSSAFVALIGTAGATKTLALQGVTPSGYNTTTNGATFTVVDATTLSYSNTTTGAASGTAITLNDLYTTTGGQSPLNSSWQSGGGAWNLNDWLPTQVGSSGPTTIVSLNSVRAGTTPDTTLYYTWAVDGTAYKYVFADNATAGPTLGVHPSTFGHTAEAVEYRTAFAALT